MEFCRGLNRKQEKKLIAKTRNYTTDRWTEWIINQSNNLPHIQK